MKSRDSKVSSDARPTGPLYVDCRDAGLHWFPGVRVVGRGFRLEPKIRVVSKSPEGGERPGFVTRERDKG